MSNPLIVTSSIVVHNTPAMRMASSARTCRQLMYVFVLIEQQVFLKSNVCESDTYFVVCKVRLCVLSYLLGRIDKTFC